MLCYAFDQSLCVIEVVISLLFNSILLRDQSDQDRLIRQKLLMGVKGKCPIPRPVCPL